MTPLLSRGPSPLLGLERTRHVRRRLAGGRPSAAPAPRSGAPPDRLRCRTLGGRVRSEPGVDLKAFRPRRGDLFTASAAGLVMITLAFPPPRRRDFHAISGQAELCGHVVPRPSCVRAARHFDGRAAGPLGSARRGSLQAPGAPATCDFPDEAVVGRVKDGPPLSTSPILSQ